MSWIKNNTPYLRYHHNEKVSKSQDQSVRGLVFCFADEISGSKTASQSQPLLFYEKKTILIQRPLLEQFIEWSYCSVLPGSNFIYQ